MGERILARREVLGDSAVGGILDGDFEEEWQPPVNRPRPWQAPGGDLGWRWERKEIENYLLDPVVVQRSLGGNAPARAEYEQGLMTARDHIAIYQAARVALSSRRPRFRDLGSSFGRPRGSGRHPFPEALDEAACRAGIRQVVTEHRETQLLAPEEVENTFQALLPACQPGGDRYRDFLHAFAGKDLLWAMDGALHDFGGAAVFLEKVLTGISGTAEDISEWLHEWRSLQQAIDRLP
jgi:hypothetical protein